MKRFVCFLLISLFIVSCSKPDLNEYITDAKNSIANHELRKAVIVLKNAITEYPNNKEVRYILGEVYLKSGDGESAEKEFGRYIEYGGDREKVTIYLGQSLLMQHLYQRVLDEIKETDAKSTDKPDIYVLYGESYLGLGKSKMAKRAFENAITMQVDFIPAKLGMVQLYLSLNDTTSATVFINEAISLDKKNPYAWYLDGLLKSGSKNKKGALESFQKSVSLYGNYIYGEQSYRARIALIRSLLAAGDNDGAKPHIVAISRVSSDFPQTIYVEAIYAYQTGDFDKALERLQAFNKLFPDHLPSNLMLGAVLYRNNSLEQANGYISRYVSAVPTNIYARKLLAAVRARLSRSEDALKILTQGNVDVADTELLTAIGRLAIETGDKQLAIRNLETAYSNENSNEEVITLLASVYLNDGRYDDAINLYEKYSENSKDKKNLLLVDAYVKKGDLEKAETLVQRMLSASPNSAEIITVTGYLALSKGEQEKAAGFFNDALKIDSGYVPALLYQASLEMQNGQYKQAQKNLDQILLKDTGNVYAYVGLAQIEAAQGRLENTYNFLKKASENVPDSIIPVLLLADFHLKNGMPRKALDVLHGSKYSQNKDARLKLLEARAYKATGDIEKAINIYSQIIDKTAEGSPAYIELATLYLRANQPDKTKAMLNKVLQKTPESIVAKGALSLVYLKEGKFNQAMEIARNIKRDMPSSYQGYLLAGDVSFVRKKYGDAQSNYFEALQRNNSTKIVYKLFNSYYRGNQKEKGLQFLESWTNDNPSNYQVMFNLANLYSLLKRFDKAIALYQKVVAVRPDHLGALNNLSLLYIPKDMKKAVQYARQIYAKAPDNKEIIDTVGWVYLKNNEMDIAAPLIERAAKGNKNPSVQYHYSVLLSMKGRAEEAKEILVNILKRNKSFPEKDVAQNLLTELKAR
ncbi:MAG: PEP-CTERM system TPR-repeat protein PrsT [Gammaproteobacteria bacterium]|nr:PEP-CTERM system TPR-repeat protein PrsT [Gammaproteobacteria bacterium]